MKRYWKIFLISLTIGLTGVFNQVSALTAPSSLELGSAVTNKTEYIGQTFFTQKKLKDGTFAYCLEKEKKVPSNITVNNIGALDEYPGLVYIIENGYPNKSFTGDANKDYYITQGAVWWYMDLAEGIADDEAGHVTVGFKSTGQDSYGMRKYVKALAYDAYTNSKLGQYNASFSLSVSGTTLNLSSDNKYFISNLISLGGKHHIGSYTVDSSSLPTGTVLLDSDDKVISGFVVSDDFKIKIPISSLSLGNNNIKVSVKASVGSPRAYGFSPTDELYQNITPTIIYHVSNTLSDNITLNTSVTTKVNIYKKDKTSGNAISGAELVIKNSAGNIVKTITSTNSVISIENLNPGTYYLEETKQPSGYYLSAEKVSFTVEFNKTTNVNFYNTKTKTSISKQDITNKEELKGAHLIVRDKNNKVVDEWDSDGSVHYIYGLVAGNTYTLEETISPNGYYLGAEKVSFTVNKNGVETKVIMYNTPTKVIINKLDSHTKEFLKGAKLVVKDSNDNVIDEWESADTSHEIYDLKIGETYYLEEINAPSGYYISLEKISFTVGEKEDENQVTMYNTPTKVTINKLDIRSKEFLKGAKLVVKDSSGNVVDEWESDNASHEISNLKIGETYYLEEIEAPNGYSKAETVEFEVDDKEVTIVNMYDSELVKVPDTGINMSLILILFGSLLVVSGISLILYYKKKNNA